MPSNDPNANNIPRTTLLSDGRGQSWNQMNARVTSAYDQNIAPLLAQGKNVLLVSHQFVMGILTEHLYKPGPMTPGLEAGDFVKTGHKIPNATPQYWPVHVFKDAQGNYVSVPASTGAQGGTGPSKAPGAAAPSSRATSVRRRSIGMRLLRGSQPSAALGRPGLLSPTAWC